MSAKTNAEVVIDGKVYTLSGYENEEYLQKVAAYINNKIAEFDDMDEYKHLPGNMKSTLIELNIADDYFKAKALVEKLEGDTFFDVWAFVHILFFFLFKFDVGDVNLRFPMEPRFTSLKSFDLDIYRIRLE